MKDKIFLDTNILVYLSNQESLFHKPVKKSYKEIVKNFEIWISRQVLREFAVVLSRQEIYDQPLNSEEIAKDISKWEKMFKVADETEEVTDNLKILISKYNIKGKRIHDTNIVATMMVEDVSTLFTYNIKDFKSFDEIEAIDLFPPEENE